MTIPDYKRAFQAIQMFKDEYLLDYINVEQLGERDEDIDERVIENEIVHNVKNFIMTFGRGFSYMGNQVHYDKLGHDHWVDLLFFNRILKSLVVIELKKGSFKPAYLGQLAAYLRVLEDNKVEYGGNAMTLAEFTAENMPENSVSKSGVCKGPKYFSYKGVTLYKPKNSFLKNKE